jgi:Cu/Ag efflux pump CusA
MFAVDVESTVQEIQQNRAQVQFDVGYYATYGGTLRIWLLQERWLLLFLLFTAYFILLFFALAP